MKQIWALLMKQEIAKIFYILFYKEFSATVYKSDK